MTRQLNETQPIPDYLLTGVLPEPGARLQRQCGRLFDSLFHTLSGTSLRLSGPPHPCGAVFTLRLRYPVFAVVRCVFGLSVSNITYNAAKVKQEMCDSPIRFH